MSKPGFSQYRTKIMVTYRQSARAQDEETHPLIKKFDSENYPVAMRKSLIGPIAGLTPLYVAGYIYQAIVAPEEFTQRAHMSGNNLSPLTKAIPAYGNIWQTFPALQHSSSIKGDTT
ncbi:hypothetical protein SAMN05216516_102331 [Izhakiella capsodis]|uniref:Uncharacterized protein n=1 Tax=Izhakiella capsodis TaxID=1367852 RepID=A0A1I4W7K9_9GAMM|nr:hypothetical protein [Izhakiella capsodis]SFN09347.1 hypothetical protein SAMN05216516_102331 [Izhakiella capsodis]